MLEAVEGRLCSLEDVGGAEGDAPCKRLSIFELVTVSFETDTH